LGRTVAHRKYTPAEEERALCVLAITGNAEAARRQLAAQGLDIPARTLRAWRLTHADRIRELTNKHLAQVREVIAGDLQRTAMEAGEVEREALAKTRKQLKDGTIKDASTAARNASVSKGISLDHMQKMRGEPTQIVEHRHAAEIIADLQKRFPRVVYVEGEAHEVRPVRELPDGTGQ
jgi:hypothetical protein